MPPLASRPTPPDLESHRGDTPDVGAADRKRAMLEIARELATVMPAQHDPDLTSRQLLALHVLSQAPRGVGEVARELGVTISSASGLVDRLVRLRLVGRGRADPPEDRRRVVCRLTSEGAAALTDHIAVGNLRLETLLKELDSHEICQVEQAMALLVGAARRVIARARDPEPATPPGQP